MTTLVKLEVSNATQTEILKNIDDSTKHVHGEQEKQFFSLESRVAKNEKWIERIIGGSIMLGIIWGIFQFAYPLFKK